MKLSDASPGAWIDASRELSIRSKEEIDHKTDIREAKQGEIAVNCKQ
jgi:hypothetical protein